MGADHLPSLRSARAPEVKEGQRPASNSAPQINHSLVRLKGPFLGADLASRTAGRAERVKGAERDRSHAQRSEHGEDPPFDAPEHPAKIAQRAGRI